MSYTSQFTIYQSGDTSAPTLNGLTGSLLTVLDACLVNGYGSKPGAGWIKPFPNTGSAGCYQQPTGSMLYLSVNDAAGGAGGGQEARITGYDSLTSIASGSNPFPSGSFIVARKSAAASATARTWIIVADSSSFYGFVLTGDFANNYYAFSFGDFYSLSGSADAWKAMVVGRATENNSTQAVENLDRINALSAATTGHYVGHTFSGTGTALNVGKHGDAVKGNSAVLLGNVQFPNGTDNGLYLSPVWVHETANSTVRGVMRGFYQYLHPIANATDGQTFSGSGAFNGYTFLVIKQSGNGGVYIIETSNTVQTN